jgi:F-type H+-transporting ATPase subunit delta
VTSLIVAKRYAKALLELGKEEGQMEQYGQELAEMVATFDASPELEKVLANPAIERDARKRVLEAVLEKMGLSPMVNNFFRLLMDRGRINQTRNILMVYERLLDEAKGITRAQVTTAAPLSDDDVAKLAEALKQVAGREVQIEVKEDPSLIGGVVARIGDLVLDGSVKTQLESLKESLRRGEYA